MLLTQLSHRAIVSLTGGDRAVFLQGITTNNVEKITPHSLLYTLLLTPNGRFLYDLFIFEHEGAWLIDCEKERVDLLIQHLKKYKLRSNVLIEGLSEWNIYAALENNWDGKAPNLTFSDSRHTQLGKRIYSKDTFLNIDNNQKYEETRISLGIPDGSRDMPVEKSIPLECNMKELGAIDWNKGCYMGQEFTARTNYLGQIRKRLLPIYSDQLNLKTNDVIMQNDEEVGQIRSVCTNHALALLRLSIFENTAPLTCNNIPIKCTIPKWLEDSVSSRR